MNETLDQSKIKVKKKVNDKDVNLNNPWDAAIAEAKRRIADLRFSIKDFTKRKERGDRWLGV